MAIASYMHSSTYSPEIYDPIPDSNPSPPTDFIFGDFTQRAQEKLGSTTQQLGIPNQLPLPLNQVPELMNDHHWHTPQAQQQHYNTSQGLGGLPAHQRNSSLSTLGSAGPSSPFAPTLSNPHIALADSASDGLPDVTFPDTAMFASAKQGLLQDTFCSQYPLSLGQSQSHSHRNLLPPYEFQYGLSNPVSVASSVASDSPATPSDGPPKRRQQSFNHKPDRTMADGYTDGMYPQTFTVPTTIAPSTPATAASPSSEFFNRTLRAAQNLPLTNEPGGRENSPFCPESPLSHNFNPQSIQRGSRQDMHLKTERNDAAIMYHQQEMVSTQPEVEPIHTMSSPADALLDFDATGNDDNYPLFSPQNNGHNFVEMGDASLAHVSQSFGSIPVTAGHENSFARCMPTSMPEQYAYMPRAHDSVSIPQQHQQHQQHNHIQTPVSPKIHALPRADRGTFSCTYQGCPQRFETAGLLQKHKREGHRQAHGLGTGHRESLTDPMDTQNGPHKCTQFNPSTGKPCNTEFSRPYDLTRHEDTIHNPKKRKVTCPACTDKKQFSRGDALSRHYRVCHPELPVPGKKRGGSRS